MQRYCKVSAMQNESWKTLNYRMFIMTKSYSKLQFICLIGGSCPNLGPTRPRVGICKSRLEALTCKYMNITNSSIASLGHRAPSWQCRRGDASPPGEDAPPPIRQINCSLSHKIFIRFQNL